MKLDSRVEFHRVILKSHLDASSGLSRMVLKAYSTGGQRSSRVASLCEANGLVILPALAISDDGKTVLQKGEHVQALIIGEIEME